MPKDKSGKFHPNVQRAMASDKYSSGPKEPEPKSVSDGASDGGSHTTLHDHGDGTFHTEGHDGEHVEHPDIHSAMAHMKSKHGGMEDGGDVCPMCGAPMSGHGGGGGETHHSSSGY